MPEQDDDPEHRNTHIGKWPHRLASHLPLIWRPAQTRLSPNDDRYLQRIHDFLRLLNGEWDWDVFVALHRGPLQYKDLLATVRAHIPTNRWPGRAHRHLQEGTLCRTLQRLTQGKLLEREKAETFPFPTRYWLTPPAQELLAVMVPAAEWAEAHADLVVLAQRRRRAPGK
ncbi:winged helix-turn-helix transcriptional regulator [Streptomyces longispororuber]|uniref:winged helix-turn-helix transcriptional regulator n=1 Tax=Streptomyces longispororuber TaxID=68230 RepID=UPI0036FD34EC